MICTSVLPALSPPVSPSAQASSLGELAADRAQALVVVPIAGVAGRPVGENSSGRVNSAGPPTGLPKRASRAASSTHFSIGHAPRSLSASTRCSSAPSAAISQRSDSRPPSQRRLPTRSV